MNNINKILEDIDREFFERFGANKIWVSPSRDNVETILEIHSFLRTSLTTLLTETLREIVPEEAKYGEICGDECFLGEEVCGQICDANSEGWNSAIKQMKDNAKSQGIEL